MGILTIATSILVIAFVLLVVALLLFWWLYRRATKETAFVRTGLGSQKVVINGGAFVIPVFHDIITVSMNTVKLDVTCSENNSIITHDRMRVDVVAQFYVRVGHTQDSVALAAQTLGPKTSRPEALRDLLEGRFVDALRTVAAEMTMEELHEQRGEYISRVKNLVAKEIVQTGLELESASLTALDQTNKEFFNPDNAFDAEGLTRLTNEIEERRRKRTAIEQDSEISIQEKSLQTQTLKLQLAKDEENARLAQEQEISLRRAEQAAAISTAEAEKKKEAEEAQVTAKLKVEIINVQADKQVELEKIASQKAIDEMRYKTEQEVQETAEDTELALKLHRIEKEKAIAIQLAEQQSTIALTEAEQQKVADHATIKANHEVEKERVLNKRDLELKKVEADKTVEISQHEQRKSVALADMQTKLAIDLHSLEQQQSVMLAEHQKDIAIAKSSKAQVQSLSEAEAEKKKLVMAEEELARLRAIEREERSKAIELIQASIEPEKESTSIRISAQARQKEAEELAKVAEIETRSKVANITAMAQADAKSEKERAMAYQILREIEAKTMKEIIAAENSMSPDIIAMKIRQSVIENLKDIIRESAKPMEAIDEIKILQANGLFGNKADTATSPNEESNKNLADQVVDSALRYRAQAPVVDSLLKDVGLSSLDTKGLSDMLQKQLQSKNKNDKKED